ncbi:nucleotidyltransferase [Lactococcus termiticola]|uniref:tRNA(Met) cytidine acetate ligase n=1 Tax=Lactococcus termiticola TaxID=2169526 RepID=A0A2R5HFH0_9LACT|nr:nucleotidyltransferase [Lactococcus termiticola]GBG96586.1 nucleotidyltransferase [Lactococcus termiticola]
MQKTRGIIAEFNPFHLGHKRLLDAGSDCTQLVVMSGNWMQRGEPAFIDKWLRAEMALKNGADLVVELPFLASVQGADFFAKGAVDILSRLGIDELAFGTESDTDYQQIAVLYAEKADEMQAYIEALPSHISYPVRAQQAWEHFAAVQFDGNTPNHILGLAYAKAVAGRGIQLKTIQRNTAYNDSELGETFASATAIRQHLETAESFVPANIWPILQEAPKISWSDFWPLLKYKIIATDIRRIYQVNDELASRIKKAVKTADSLDALIEQVYTKRYTKGHIRRLMAYILNDVDKKAVLPEAIRVLGFNEKGRQILARARKSDIELCSRIGQFPWDAVTQRADEIYRLGNPAITEQNYGRKPLILG